MVIGPTNLLPCAQERHALLQDILSQLRQQPLECRYQKSHSNSQRPQQLQTMEQPAAAPSAATPGSAIGSSTSSVGTSGGAVHTAPCERVVLAADQVVRVSSREGKVGSTNPKSETCSKLRLMLQRAAAAAASEGRGERQLGAQSATTPQAGADANTDADADTDVHANASAYPMTEGRRETSAAGKLSLQGGKGQSEVRDQGRSDPSSQGRSDNLQQLLRAAAAAAANAPTIMPPAAAADAARLVGDAEIPDQPAPSHTKLACADGCQQHVTVHERTVADAFEQCQQAQAQQRRSHMEAAFTEVHQKPCRGSTSEDKVVEEIPVQQAAIEPPAVQSEAEGTVGGEDVSQDNVSQSEVSQDVVSQDDISQEGVVKGGFSQDASAFEEALRLERAIAVCKEYVASSPPSAALRRMAAALCSVLGAVEGAVAGGRTLPAPLATAAADAAISLLAAATQFQVDPGTREFSS